MEVEVKGLVEVEVEVRCTLTKALANVVVAA